MKKLFTRNNKQNQTLKKSLRFNPVIAIIVVVAVGGVGAWTIKNSSAAIDNQIRVVAIQSGSNLRIPGARAQIYSTNGGYCSTATDFGTSGSGFFDSSCSSTNGSGQGAYYCIVAGSGGSNYIYNGFGQVSLLSSTQPNAYLTTTHNGNLCVYAAAGTGVQIPLYYNAKTTTSLAANGTYGNISVTKGKTVALSWSSTDARTCNFNGGVFDTRSETSGEVSFVPTETGTFTVSCQGQGTGTDSSSTVKVTVTNPPPTNNNNPSQNNTNNPSSPSKPTTPSKNTAAKKKATPAPVKATVKATSGDTSPPSKPSEFSGSKSQDGAIKLTWSAASDNVGVKSYVIERSIDAVEWEVLGQEVTETSYTDDNLSDDVAYYYYRLRSQDAVGNQSEAAFIDIEHTSASSSDGGNEEDPDGALREETDKKGMSGTMVGLSIVGGLFLLGLIGGAIVLYRRRKANDYDYSQYQAPAQTFAPPSQPTNVVVPGPGQQQNAPHTSQSLKDMVLEDYDHSRHDGPPPPPSQSGQQ